jgi:hypothetical protein
MYITRKKSTANLRLIDNLIILPDTLTVYGELFWLTLLQNQETCGLKQWLIVCVLSVMKWLVLHVATQILICTNKLKTADKSLPPLFIFISWNPWHPCVKPWGFAEPSLRNIVLYEQLCVMTQPYLTVQFHRILVIMFVSLPSILFFTLCWLSSISCGILLHTCTSLLVVYWLPTVYFEWTHFLQHEPVFGSLVKVF